MTMTKTRNHHQKKLKKVLLKIKLFLKIIFLDQKDDEKKKQNKKINEDDSELEKEIKYQVYLNGEDDVYFPGFSKKLKSLPVKHIFIFSNNIIIENATGKKIQI